MIKNYINVVGTIKAFIMIPFELVAYTLQIPNFKIVYKSGHVERFFLLSIKRYDGEWKWETPVGTQKRIVIIGVDDIVSVTKLY